MCGDSRSPCADERIRNGLGQHLPMDGAKIRELRTILLFFSVDSIDHVGAPQTIEARRQPPRRGADGRV